VGNTAQAPQRAARATAPELGGTLASGRLPPEHARRDSAREQRPNPAPTFLSNRKQPYKGQGAVGARQERAAVAGGGCHRRRVLPEQACVAHLWPLLGCHLAVEDARSALRRTLHAIHDFSCNFLTHANITVAMGFKKYCGLCSLSGFVSHHTFVGTLLYICAWET
jgi:hypothetical protein